MAMNLHNDTRDPEFLREIDKVKSTIGKSPLSDDELIFLACEEISRTYTHEEKKYQA
jgi:hypothetical protein